MIRRLFISLVLCLIIFTSVSYSDNNSEVWVSIGEDLNKEQKEQILEIFGADGDVEIIQVSNKEEREYLGDYVDESLIGTRAISSSYVEKLQDHEGIDVETYNITWVTKDMYRNALVTAGIKDAKVKIAAPVKVSGTAALTGIIKAFEGITGEAIDERNKKTANEEIAKTGQLGQEIGKEKASQLIKEVKEEILNRAPKNENEIRQIVIQIAGDLNIQLNKQQEDEIVVLMKSISQLDLNVEEIRGQLNEISGRLKSMGEDNKEIKSILQRILDFIREILKSIGAWVSKNYVGV